MTPTDLVARVTLPSPLGPLTSAATARGVALLWFDGTALPALDGVPEQPGQRWLAQLAAELEAYWADPRAPFRVPLDLQGTPFRQAVWQALRTIPAGATRTYGEVAAQAAGANAVRAVGAACGANPVGIVVPCHRVIGRDGTLTGYAGGLARKAALLRHEAAQASLAA